MTAPIANDAMLISIRNHERRVKRLERLVMLASAGRILCPCQHHADRLMRLEGELRRAYDQWRFSQDARGYFLTGAWWYRPVRVPKEAGEMSNLLESAKIILQALDDITDGTSIVGWHRNGELATWEELGILDCMKALREAVAEAPGEAEI